MRAVAESFAPGARWHLPVAAASAAALYYLGARLGLARAFAPVPSAVLSPSLALLLAALTVCPRQWWWALIAAVFPAHLLVQLEGGMPALTGLAWFASNVAAAALGATLLCRLGGPSPALRSSRSLLAFVGTLLAAPLLGSLVDAALVRAIGWSNAGALGLGQERFVSSVLAIVALVPALVTAMQARVGEFPRLPRARVGEAGTLAIGLLVACLIAFHAGSTPAFAAIRLFLPIPFLVWAALRFGVSFSSSAFAVVTVLAIVGAAPGEAPFAAAALAQGAVPLQVFLILLGASLLLLAGLVQERSDAQEALRGVGALYATAFRSAPVALAISRRPGGELLEANDEWRRVMGQDPSARRPDTRDTETLVPDAAGRTRVTLLSAVPAQAGGEACEITTASDITAQRQAEAEARDQRRQLTHLTRVASLTDFSGTLAHELNQPLTAILSNAQAALRMLSHEVPDVAEVRVILRDIAEADKRAGVLIHHLRLLMKDSNEQFVQVDLNQVVQQVLDLIGGEFLLRHVDLKTSFCSDLPKVHGDPVQLQQLLLNLMLNACEAMQDGGLPERVLSIATHDGAHGMVQVLLSDTGPGIPQDLLHRVFEPFYTTKSNGLGLGLSMCRKIAISHGGTLTAQTGRGRGATFRFAVPAVRPAGLQRGAVSTSTTTNS